MSGDMADFTINNFFDLARRLAAPTTAPKPRRSSPAASAARAASPGRNAAKAGDSRSPAANSTRA